jgi:hypothetical protein
LNKVRGKRSKVRGKFGGEQDRAMKTCWLSFCDEKTGQNLGVCVVEVSDEHAREAVERVKRIKGVCPEGVHECLGRHKEKGPRDARGPSQSL